MFSAMRLEKQGKENGNDNESLLLSAPLKRRNLVALCKRLLATTSLKRNSAPVHAQRTLASISEALMPTVALTRSGSRRREKVATCCGNLSTRARLRAGPTADARRWERPAPVTAGSAAEAGPEAGGRVGTKRPPLPPPPEPPPEEGERPAGPPPPRQERRAAGIGS